MIANSERRYPVYFNAH